MRNAKKSYVTRICMCNRKIKGRTRVSRVAVDRCLYKDLNLKYPENRNVSKINDGVEFTTDPAAKYFFNT